MTTNAKSGAAIPSAECAPGESERGSEYEASNVDDSVSASKSALHAIPVAELADEQLFPAYIAAVDDEELEVLPDDRRSRAVAAEMMNRDIEIYVARGWHLAARGI